MARQDDGAREGGALGDRHLGAAGGWGKNASGERFEPDWRMRGGRCSMCMHEALVYVDLRANLPTQLSR